MPPDAVKYERVGAAALREDVVRAAHRVEPKGIQKWSVLVEDKEFPVKQLLMEAANLIQSAAPRATPADFIAHYAVRRFKRLGFPVRYYEGGYYEDGASSLEPALIQKPRAMERTVSIRSDTTRRPESSSVT